jgi:hypothetical protein
MTTASPDGTLSELDRKRLASMNTWTPEQTLAAALTDLRTNAMEGELVSVLVMCVVVLPSGRVRLPWYQGGFANVAEELGYLDMFAKRIRDWWSS